MSPSCCVFTKGTSPMLITTHHHCVMKGTSLQYQSQLIIMLVSSKGARPSVINHNSSSCFHESTSLRAINHNSSSCWFSRKGTSSVLSITTHHHKVFTKGTSLQHQSQLIIMLCFTKGTSLRAINHNSSS
jgi:hypothetical protein